jgi:hypothetical protein
MLKEVMNDLWLAKISSLSNEVGLYVVLLEVLLFMPNSKTHNDDRQTKYPENQNDEQNRAIKTKSELNNSFREGKQFLFLITYSSCYSYYQVR